MCILFSYVSKLIAIGQFRLILINNRDEYFHRPSTTANFVEETNLYAKDLTQGKEGGTWLGISKKGRIGVLLNLDSQQYDNDASKLGRGNIVPNYLNFDESAEIYLKELSLKAKNYNPFNLILYEKAKNDLWEPWMYNNYDSKIQSFNSDFLSISNHLYEDPYIKTTFGQREFEKIISTYNNTSTKDILIDKLLELLKTDSGCIDNENTVYCDAKDDVTNKIFVNYSNYGTRTHTIILVDDQNRVNYNEYTLNLSIDQKTKTEWISQSFEFDLVLNSF